MSDLGSCTLKVVLNSDLAPELAEGWGLLPLPCVAALLLPAVYSSKRSRH